MGGLSSKKIIGSVLFSILSLGVYSSLFAQQVALFHLNRFTGTLRLQYRTERRIEPQYSKRPYYREVFDLRNKGFVINPAVFSFQWIGNLSLSQEHYVYRDFKQYSKARFFNNYLSGLFFSRSAYPTSFVFSKLKNVTDTDYGGRTSYNINRYQATTIINKKFMPSTLIVGAEEMREKWSRIDWSTQLHQLRRTLQYEGQRGEKSNISLSYNLLDIKDRIYADRSFTSHNAHINFIRYFGHDSSQTWNGGVRFYRRRGLRNYENIRTFQTIQLKHKHGFSSQYRYSISNIRLKNYSSLLQSAFFALNHQLYSSLNTTIGAGGTSAKLTDGRESSRAFNGGINYNKHIPFSGNLRIVYNRAYSVEDRNLKNIIQTVVREQHVFIGDFPVFFNERNIIVSTIVVYNEQGSIIYEEGEDKDYIIRTVDDLVEIYRNPLGRIQENQRILVDYQFRTLPSMKYSTNTTIFNMGVHFKWISFYYRINHHYQDLLRGSAEKRALLQNMLIKTIGLKLTRRGNTWGTSLFIERIIRESNLVAYRLLETRNVSFLQLNQVLTVSSKLTFSLFDYSHVNRNINIYSARPEIRWYPTNLFSVKVYGELRLRQDSAGYDQFILDLASFAQWSWRVMKLQLSYHRQTWKIGPRRVKINRFIVNFERYF
ncbi:MAG: hypothetical protein GXO76_12905 [Calditrichaeota bacterium]|nr:hypothetical protein [Calditrichota bacterium]